MKILIFDKIIIQVWVKSCWIPSVGNILFDKPHNYIIKKKMPKQPFQTDIQTEHNRILIYKLLKRFLKYFYILWHHQHTLVNKTAITCETFDISCTYVAMEILLHYSISSQGSLIYVFLETGQHIPWSLI